LYYWNAKSANLALKANVIEKEVSYQTSVEARLGMCLEDMIHEYNEHMDFYGRTFWQIPTKLKKKLYEEVSQVDFKEMTKMVKE
jgi:hypothetical protein